MVMSQSVLATELENMVPTENESEAITRLTDAYGTFATDAVGNGIPILPSGITLGKAAMAAGLVGMSSPNAGLTKIPTAIIAFWVAAAIPASFPGSTAVVPPPNAGLAALLGTVFAANTTAELSLEDSMAAIATAMYSQAIIGGTVTISGPSVGPIL